LLFFTEKKKDREIRRKGRRTKKYKEMNVVIILFDQTVGQAWEFGTLDSSSMYHKILL